MRYATISSALPPVSRLVLGSDSFGTPVVPEAEAFRLLDMYIDRGGNCVDTARVYACWIDNMLGASETTIGRYLHERGGRDRLLISTKCAHPDGAGWDAPRLDEENIRRDVEDSLRALQTDYIDILWLHRDHTTADFAQIFETLEALRREGKIRVYGASNWRPERMRLAAETAERMGAAGFVGAQIKWSLARTKQAYTDDPTLVEYDEDTAAGFDALGLPVFAYAPQAKGLFSKFSSEMREGDKAKLRYLDDENLKKARRVEFLARQLGATNAQVALAYLTSGPLTVFPILGCKKVAQLEDSMGTADLVLTPAQREFLDLRREDC